MTVGLEWQNNLLREKNILQKENESLPFLKKFLKKFSQNKISNNSTWLILKETVSWDFLSSFFQDSNQSGPVIYLLKFFRMVSNLQRYLRVQKTPRCIWYYRVKLRVVNDPVESNSAVSFDSAKLFLRHHRVRANFFCLSLPLVAL